MTTSPIPVKFDRLGHSCIFRLTFIFCPLPLYPYYVPWTTAAWVAAAFVVLVLLGASCIALSAGRQGSAGERKLAKNILTQYHNPIYEFSGNMARPVLARSTLKEVAEYVTMPVSRQDLVSMPLPEASLRFSLQLGVAVLVKSRRLRRLQRNRLSLLLERNGACAR